MFIHIGGVNVHLRTRLQVRHRSYKADIGLSARPARQILSRSFVMSGKHVGNGERCLGANALWQRALDNITETNLYYLSS